MATNTIRRMAIRPAAMRGLKWSLLVLICAALFSCVSVNGEQSTESDVAKRASERWGFLIDGRLDKAYRYLSLGKRDLWSKRRYRAEVGAGVGRWKTAVVQGVRCDVNRCEVDVDVGYLFRGHTVTTNHHEIWIQDDGKWWFVGK